MMNVITKQTFDFSINELSSPAQIAFFEYWQEIKGERQMPSKIDFNPMKIPRSLPHIIMEEVHYDPVRFKIRLIGSKCQTPGHYKGQFVNGIPELKQATEMLSACVETKKPYFYYNTITYGNGLVKFYTSLVLPFSQDDNKVNIVMAAQCPIK